jgi:nucleotide-binding universal stress UspA family protein
MIVVEPLSRGRRRSVMMRTIVVGVDGSDNSVSALEWAAGQAQLQGADLRAVFVWKFPYMEVVPAGLGTTLPPFPEMQKAAEARLDEIIGRARLPHDLTVTRVAIEGDPARELLDQSKDATLVVVGARGHEGFLGVLTGSVATRVVNHATVPVAVIRA